MMRTIAALFALLIAGAACAQTKVGYVDVNEITRKARQVKAIFNEIEDKMQDLQKQIKDKQTKITELKNEIRRSDGVLAKEEVDKKRKEQTRLEGEYQELSRKAQEEMQRMDDTRFEPLMKTINYTIQDIAKEQKYDLVLRGEAVLYGTSGVDLTAEVIRRMDAQGELKPDSEPQAKADAPGTDAAPANSADTTPTPQTSAPAAPEATSAPDEPEPVAAQATATPAASKPAATPADAPRKAESKPAGTRPVDRQPE